MGGLFSKQKILQYKLGFALFVVTGLYALVTLFVGLGALNFVLAVLAAGMGLVASVYAVATKKLHPYLTASLITMFVASVLFILIWGADAKGRLLYGLVLALPALAGVGMLVASVVRSAPRGFVAFCAVAMLSFMVMFVLFMDLRYKPLVQSLQQGHDEYLEGIKNKNNADSPNVLFIIMDDLGYADISRYSYKDDNPIINTPNIDSIGEFGTTLTNFYASSPVCSPSRCGLMTGRYAMRGYQDNVVFPSDHSVDPFNYFRFVNTFEFQKNVQGMLGDEITFAEVLQAQNYKTGAFGKWHLGDTGQYLPANQGFDYFYGTLHVNDVPNYEFYRNTKDSLEKTVKNKDMDQSLTTAILKEETKDFISSAVDNNEKFFAYYSSPWPHAPLDAGKDFYGTSDGGRYGDCIEEFDHSVGEIFDLLKEKGVYEDTLIIFTSDNGPGKEGATGALRGRKGTTFDGGQKVPMLVQYAKGGVKAGYTVDAPQTNLDFFPTILDFVGVQDLPTDRIIDGVSIKSLLTGDSPSNVSLHDAIYHIRRSTVQAVSTTIGTGDEATRYKYYERVQNENSAFFNQYYTDYTFDLTNDPIEAYNITPNNKELAATLKEKLLKFRRELKANRRGKL